MIIFINIKMRSSSVSLDE